MDSLALAIFLVNKIQFLINVPFFCISTTYSYEGIASKESTYFYNRPSLGLKSDR